MSPPPAADGRDIALRRAAVRAAAAPSVLDTQPWKLRIRGGLLYVHADHGRQLAALDPQRRQLTMSVGCAVMNARVALAASGYAVTVHRFPEPMRPDLVAVLDPDSSHPPCDDLAALARPSSPPLSRARTPAAADVPLDVLARMADLVAAEGTSLHILSGAQRPLVAEVGRQARDIENLDPSYRAELHAWTSGDPRRRERGADPAQCLGVLASAADGPVDWVRAGESTQRILLELARAGYVASPASQVTEVPSARARLRRELGLTGHPHVLLRLGRSPAFRSTRRLVDVLVEES